ncbi:saccharopine dehydrogenase family protein [Actinomycetospora sp. CA-053990]|uniref:saccharopine dehydrogenase family protein n=1 Tax=Actinomycetospora sp. CA-053990 TaxID=3239891 RepID=UPI003D92B98B
MSEEKVVFIGAGGEMCRVAVERFAATGDAHLVLADINSEALEKVTSTLPPGRATTTTLDLFDPASLSRAIEGASLVVLGAGPYQRTAEPVINACLEARIPYLDFDDDVESTDAALSLHERAQEAGVPCYIGCGASPGMSNVMVLDAAADLDSVDTLDICWLVGDERPGIGRAVLEHLMHIAAGPCLTWAEGKPTVNETWVETAYAPMGGGAGETLLHETAHPEAVTVPRLYPNATRIRVLGGLDPAPFNGIARGLAKAVRRRSLPLDAAVDFLVDLLDGKPGSLKGWRHALAGMVEQVRTGECTTGEVLDFLISSARGKTAPTYRGGLLVRAIGARDGRPAVSIKRTPTSGAGTFLFKDMAAITGTACAAFMTMALDLGRERPGVFAPEDWAQPEAFYKALERVGTPRAEIIESLTPSASSMAEV